MQPLLGYYLVSRPFVCHCFCTAQQKSGCIDQDQKVIKCYGTNFVCPIATNKVGSCISSLMLAGIHLNTESFKEWSEELFNGIFSSCRTAAWGKCLYEKKQTSWVLN